MSETSANIPRTIHQVCAIPYRKDADRVEFCLITSLKKHNWIFPKGIIDPGETFEESALKEAFEEAGLRGRIQGQPLGHFFDAKWGARLIVKVVVMEVTQSEQTWPENESRQRRWAEYDSAQELLTRRELKNFLQQARRVLFES